MIESPSGEQFEVVERAGPVELQRAPQIPAEAREELLVIKDRELFLCARVDGDIAPAQVSGEGFYAFDTRYLSEMRLEVGGQRPVSLSYTQVDEHAVVDATNAQIYHSSLEPIPQLSLSITREFTIASGRLYKRVVVQNFMCDPVSTTVALTLAADFADMFEVRGGVRRDARGHALAPKHAGKKLVLAYLGEDDAIRETIVECEPTPAKLDLQVDRVLAEWQIDLEPGEETQFLITIEPSIGGRRQPRRGLTKAISELAAASSDWNRLCTRIRSDSELFDGLIATSVRDLFALVTPAPGGQIVAAGIPWYVAPFGRDALVSATESMILGPQLLRDALNVLSLLQATDDDPWRDAEPGKILHELRVGELAGAGVIPHTPYYGTVDATPLFLIGAANYHQWTGDLETIRALRPALDAALRWIDEYGDLDGDGFVEYRQRSPGGLENQGWKDSHDSVVHADGSLAKGPIALVEVQGYVYLAKVMVADLYDTLGDHGAAVRLRKEAEALRRQFNDVFWNADEGTFALALDGRKQQVASVTSNPGHCLYCGIVDAERADSVVERLMAPDMFSGWGVRTLSSQCPRFNPMSYHNGSVWPHDNAIVAAGMKRYGHHDAVMRIATALFEVAAGSNDLRLPELYCGFDRSARGSVVAYPVACIPQAWAAASPLLLLQAMLGITADAPGGELRIHEPLLPDWLGQVVLEGLRVGDSTVSVSFDRRGPVTGFALLERRGSVNVTVAASESSVSD